MSDSGIEYDATGAHIVICGLKGSGKTTLAKHLAAKVAPDRLAIYDPQRQFADARFAAAERHTPDLIMSRMEFEDWFSERLPQPPNLTSRADMVVVDEANIYVPSRGKLSTAVSAYLNQGRHMRVGLLLVTRRPVQLYTDAVELADMLVVFRLTGSNDVSKLNSMSAGLGVEAARLPKHHYAVVRDGEYTLHSPIDIDMEDVRHGGAKRTGAAGGARQRGRRR